MCEVFGLAEKELLSMSYSLLMGKSSAEKSRNSNIPPIFNSVINSVIIKSHNQVTINMQQITMCYKMMSVLNERF